MQHTNIEIPESARQWEPRRKARALFWQGWRLTHIAELLGVNINTLKGWKMREKWEDMAPIDRVECVLETRMVQLINKDDKDGRDFKELDLLGRQVERMARVRRFGQDGGNETDLNPLVANRNARKKKPVEKNAISDQEEQQLIDAFQDGLFGYQRAWFDVLHTERIRNILKSRQIGATFYFAREALIDALATGRNQIFLSASKAQAHVFKHYILQFVRDVVGIELTGDPIVLPNGATLYFLGTNVRTAQSYHGNLYLDEYFWIQRFQEFRKVASGMAIHKQWRQTYFSTPSSITHDAHPFWSGALFNRGRTKEERATIDTSHNALAAGLHCADGQWRQIVTVEDAVAGGCNLFDLAQLRLEYSPDEFSNLLMCEFIDDTASVFPLAVMMRCMVDTLEIWDDFKPYSTRPFGAREVWLGYDPTVSGDNAGCAVLAPPAVSGGKFRVLERHRWKGMDFAAQADAIKRLCDRYRVTYIEIDTTGIGTGVHQLVRQFRPDAVGRVYSPDVKMRLVMKAMDVIAKGRFEFDAGDKDLVQAFMSIRKTMTASGRQVTFQAGRSEETSHADIAWACMHALANEPLEGSTATNTSIMEIY